MSRKYKPQMQTQKKAPLGPNFWLRVGLVLSILGGMALAAFLLR